MSTPDSKRSRPGRPNTKDGTAFGQRGMVDIKGSAIRIHNVVLPDKDVPDIKGKIIRADDIVPSGHLRASLKGKAIRIDDIFPSGKDVFDIKGKIIRAGVIATSPEHRIRIKGKGKGKGKIVRVYDTVPPRRSAKKATKRENISADSSDVTIRIEAGDQSATLHYVPRRRKTLSPSAFDRVVQLLTTAKDEILAAAEEELSDHLSAGELEVLDRYPTADFDEHASALTEATRRLDSIESQSLTTQQVGSQLGVNSSRIRQRLEEGSLWGFKARGQWRVPSFQLRNGKLLRGVEEVNRSLRHGMDPVVVDGFFHNTNVDLVVGDVNVTPIEWLAAGGDSAPVARIAATL